MVTHEGDGSLIATQLESAPRPPERVSVPLGVDRFDDHRWPDLRRIWPGAACCALYLFLATATYGFATLGPSHMAGSRDSMDSVEQIWWLAWVAHAFPHVRQLFLAQGQNYPYGQNFGVQGSMLALGVLLLPITKVFGPIVTWNVLVRLTVAASATSMCFVLRRWTSWWPAAFLGGLIYAYCGYFTALSLYPFLAFVPLPPLIFLLLHEILIRQSWRPAVSGALLGLVCVVQFFVSTEVLALSIVTGAIAAAILVVVWRRSVVAHWHYAAHALAWAVGVACILLAYPLWFTFAGPQHLIGAPHTVAYWADLLPTDLLSLFNQGGPLATPSLYFGRVLFLGWPLVVSLGCFAVFFRKRREILFAGVMALICFVLSLGPSLWVDGRHTAIPLPAIIFDHLPVLDGLQMARFAVMTAMFAAGMFAIGIEELWRRLRESGAVAGLTSPWRAASCVVIVCALILATVVIPMMPRQTRLAQSTNVPTFFTSRAEDSIPAGSVVLAYPYPDLVSSGVWLVPVPRLLLYQAVGGMRFQLIGGYGYFPSPTGKGGTINPSELEPPSVQALFDVALANPPLQRQILSRRDLTNDLRSFLRRYKVQTVLVVPPPATYEIGGRQYRGDLPSALIGQLTDAIGPSDKENRIDAWFHVARRLGRVSP
jgi:hypothetical protein